MLLKFEIRMEVFRLLNDIDFFETPCTSQMILNFLKDPFIYWKKEKKSHIETVVKIAFSNRF